MYQYWGFGLYITSEIAFPELLPVVSAKTDVTITIGAIPRIPEGLPFSTKNVSYISNEKEMYFTVRDTAAYYIDNGRSIIISPYDKNAVVRTIRLFVLGGAMAGILQQRRQIPLHTASILKDEALTLICGQSGAGKSTTLAGLIRNGYNVFSDDITVLQTAEQQISGCASYPMIKLWEDSIYALNDESFEDRSYRIMPELNKYGIFFHDSFSMQSYPIEKIIVLRIGTEKQVVSEQLYGGNAFTEVMQHIYKPRLFDHPALRAHCFQVITTLLQHTRIYQVSRPAGCLPEELLSAVTTLISE